MKATNNKLLKAILILTMLTRVAFGQEFSKHNLEYIASDYLDTITKRSVIVVLAATPKKMQNFPPILSMRLTYGINNQDIKTAVDIQKQEVRKVSLVVYGKTIQEKNPKLFDLIKDKIDLTISEDIMLLAFQLDDISPEAINNLEIKYGLWEKHNQNIRHEKIFKFNIRE